MKSLCQVLDAAANADPHKPLFVFPETRWQPESVLTYGQLASRAASASRLLRQVADPGNVALLLFPTGAAFWEAFVGCLASGVIAVPLKTPNLNRPSEFLSRICEDCKPRVVLTDSSSADLLRRRADRHLWASDQEILTTDAWRGDTERLSTDDQRPDQTAFVQYTSGSTSQPKGAAISHGNLMSAAAMIQERMAIGVGKDRNVTWLPHYHDMGLVGSYLETLYTRNTCWCLPPEEFVLHPGRWLRLISTHAATVCGGPDFGYRYCTQRISDEELSGIDLSSWRIAFNGAERVRPQTMRRFVERFGPLGFSETSFFPCYGLGEATLMVSGGPASRSPVTRCVSSAALEENNVADPDSDSDSLELAGSGQVATGCRVMIRDLESDGPAVANRVGEVLVAGPTVMGGYFNRPDLNDDAFFEWSGECPSTRYLKTGDLGFLDGEELFITGRLKEMLVLRGRNFFPEDIEDRAAHAHSALNAGCVVAFSEETDAEAGLVVAAEVMRAAVSTAPFAEIIDAVRERIVRDFGINPADVVLLRPATVPRTSSGKLKRLAVRNSYRAGTLRVLSSSGQEDPLTP